MSLRIYLKSELGGSCASLDDGAKILQLILPELYKGSTVEIDFEGVNMLLTPFLNASFGKILELFGKEQTMSNVVIRNVSDDFLNQINRFVDRKDIEFDNAIEREIIQEMFDEDDLTEETM